jgi:histidyl-tRNA synthetase
VPKNLVRPISSAVDKLERYRRGVKKESTYALILSADSASSPFRSISDERRIFPNTLEVLRSDTILSGNEQGQKNVGDMRQLLRYLETCNVALGVKFELSLARGLDYYTVLIYEVAPNDNSLKVGSIAAGGQYDNLAGRFSRREFPASAYLLVSIAYSLHSKVVPRAQSTPGKLTRGS